MAELRSDKRGLRLATILKAPVGAGNRQALLPGAGSKRSCQSRDDPPEEGIGVPPSNHKVDGRQHQKTVDSMAEDAGRDVFSQTCKQRAHVLHLDDLAGHEEHDTERRVPADGQEGSSCGTLVPADPLTRVLLLPHDPGHQHHGGLVEAVEEPDEDLPILPQLP